MKLLLTGDFQLEANPPHDRSDQDGRSTRFQENVETIADLIAKGAALGCTGMVHLGDLTENKNPKSVELEAAASLFNSAISDGMRIWAIAGNHDGSLFEVSSSSFAPLATMAPKDFKLFHRIQVDPELRMLAIPYRHKLSPDQVRAEIHNALQSNDSGVTFAVAHYGAEGAKVGARNLALPGDYLTADDFWGGEVAYPPYAKVFCGHIHKHQVIRLAQLKLQAVIVGSPVICDQGERLDQKVFVTYDTTEDVYEVHPVPQRRRWLQVPYSPVLFKAADLLVANSDLIAPWGPEDIVTVTGEYDKPDFPRETIEAAVKAGLARPFSLEVNVKPRKAVHELRAVALGEEDGMRENMVAFMKEKFPRQGDTPGHVAPAGDLVLGLIEEQEGKKFCSRIHPTSLSISNFMTFVRHEAGFQVGIPTLIYGGNGIGKTTLLDAMLWCLTGQTSKGVAGAGVVRQGEKEAVVELLLQGDGKTTFKVRRALKLAKSGKPTTTVSLAQKVFDNDAPWVELSDGGVVETQALINRLVGGSFNSLRVTNFKFQNDTNPIVRANPADRKRVLSEILGLDPLARAFKVVTERRLESQRAFDAEKSRLGGMVSAYEQELVGKDQAEADAAELTGSLEVKREQVAAAQAAAAQAQDKERLAKTASEEASAKLQALPNTEAVLAAAEQAIASAEAAHATAREEKTKRYTKINEQLKAATADLEKLQKEAITCTDEDKKRLEDLNLRVTEATKEVTQAETAAEAERRLDADLATQLDQARAKYTDLVDQRKLLIEVLEKGDRESCTAILGSCEEAIKGLEGQISFLRADLAASEADSRNAIGEKKKLTDQLAALQGQDIGKCSRCGQPVDSAHTEKELAEVKAQLVAVDEKLKSLTAAQLKIQSGISERTSRIVTEEAVVKTKRQQLEQLDRDSAKAETLRVAAVETESLVNTLNVKHENAGAEAQRLLKLTAERKTTLSKLWGEQKSLSVWVEGAKNAAQALELKTQLVSSLKSQLEGVAAEGTEAQGAHDVQILQLLGKRDLAMQADEANQKVKAGLKSAADLALGAAALAGQVCRETAAALATVAGDVRVMEEKLTSARERLDRLEKQKAQVEQAKLQLGMAEEKLEIEAAACALLDPREGLPVYLIDRQLPFLEERINFYLAQLGIERLAVELTTLDGDRETLAVLVDNGKSPRLDVTAFSGGQLDRIEIALKWALADLACQMRGVTFGLLAYDEPTGGLDEAGKAGLINLLFEKCAGTCPVTLVVSHDTKLIASFDNKLQFTQGEAEQTVVQ